MSAPTDDPFSPDNPFVLTFAYEVSCIELRERKTTIHLRCRNNAWMDGPIARNLVWEFGRAPDIALGDVFDITVGMARKSRGGAS